MGCRETTKIQAASGEHIGMANGNCRKDFVKVEVRELANSSP